MTNKRFTFLAGASLIELLLALSITGLITILGVQRYRLYQQDQQVQNITSDLQQIFHALNLYFAQQGCDMDGHFLGAASPLLNHDLHLNALSHGRSPWIQAYTPQITSFSTTKQSHKPLYQLMITAKINSRNRQWAQWLTQRTAGSNPGPTQQIQWRIKPQQTYQHPYSKWVLANQLLTFKRKLSAEQLYASCAQ